MGHQTTPGAGPSASLAGDLTHAQMDLVIRHLPVQVSVVDEDGTLVYWHGDLFADCELRHVGVHPRPSRQNRCKSGQPAGLRRFPAREGGDRLRPVPDASSISISTINRACGL